MDPTAGHHWKRCGDFVAQLRPSFQGAPTSYSNDYPVERPKPSLEALGEIKGIEVCPLLIGRRKAFPDAAASGQSVLEWNDDAKAAQEMAQLVQFVTKSVAHWYDVF